MTPNTELYFPVVLCKIQLKEILTFESVDEILFSLKHLNESYWTFSSRNICYMLKNTQGDSNFWVSGWISQVCKFMWKISA